MPAHAATSENLLDEAIRLAQNSSWESFNLNELAGNTGCSLIDIKKVFRSKDDMAEAFFNRADDVMLSLASDPSFLALPISDRLSKCIMTWFEYLKPYRPIVKEMMAYKLEPGHFHLQAHGITRVSRTVQWFLEVSNRNYSGFTRVADEVATTSAYLTTFAYFLFDDSENVSETRTLLKKLIRRIDKGHRFFSNRNERKIGISKNSGNKGS